MAAPIKPIDDKSSGQVIVDLCSVVKELLENSIDSGATNIDVRFKNQGLDHIEVQDNGSGISPANHACVALKHYTSKLSSYSDISSLQTFGFRGEALASLCALSQLTITTCVQSDVPKGSKLFFDSSGKLASTAVTAAQKGTTVSVENLFYNLPVRRRELERNIKREWHKVIALLNQYACIQTNLKFSVSQQPTKGKRILLFSTKGNPTTRENILNIFGSKAISALVSMDILLEMEHPKINPATQISPQTHSPSKQVRVRGHVSRPIQGDGRQTPDRQMFFVNGRPCGLPQFAKIFNEVYKSYNYSQSPFIFADIQLDTNMYDVNVSPDKRSILLHDQASLLDSLRASLGALFDSHEYRLPTASALSSQPSESLEPSHPIPPLLSSKRTPLNAEEEGPTIDDAETNKRALTASLKSRLQYASGITTEKSSRTVGNRQPSLSGWLNRDVEPEALPIVGDKASDINKFRLNLREKRTLVDDPVDDAGDVKLLSSRANIRKDQYKLKSTNEIWPENPCTGSDSDSLHDDVSSSCSKPPKISTTSGAKKLRDSLDTGSPPGMIATQDGSTPAVSINSVAPADEQHLSKFEVTSGRTNSTVCHQSSAELGETNRHGVHAKSPGNETQNQEQLASVLSSKVGLMGDARDSICEIIDDRMATVKTNTSNKERRRKFANAQRSQVIYTDEDKIALLSSDWGQSFARNLSGGFKPDVEQIDAPDAESKLPLIISKSDFAKMRIVGQFNLGFIIAIRPRSTDNVSSTTNAHDELLIIDQHASDEKFNFEALQATTKVQSQRLVRPKKLDLTALDEEIVFQNLAALEANGFQVQVDSTGTSPVGSRCQLLALPMSRESTFTLKDLEELISLLADEPAGSGHIPRPSAVRKMFAMRACRSSIMIGKALTANKMYTVVRHMGELDKPWNCPHGRPTMRHLCRIQAWDEARWTADTLYTSVPKSWASYIANADPGS
ncbi:hypothetical protein EsHS_00001108 [Epichloe bromicola]